MKGDKCSFCNKRAIGYYSTPYEGRNVCEDHAPATEPYDRNNRFSGSRLVWWERFRLYDDELKEES